MLQLAAYTGNNGDANNGGVYVIADMSSDSSLKIDGKNSDVWCTDAIKDRTESGSRWKRPEDDFCERCSGSLCGQTDRKCIESICKYGR